MAETIQDVLGQNLGRELGRVVQEQPLKTRLGQIIMDSVCEFALRDERSVDELEGGTFGRVRDPALRRTLGETLFGARWLYKLGLVTYATNERRAAHIRAQIIDYAAICEAVLGDALAHGIAARHFATDAHEWGSPRTRSGKRISWSAATIEKQLRKEWPCNTFNWKIAVAAANALVDTRRARDLDTLCRRRNKVHLAERASIARREYIDESADAFRTMCEVVDQVGGWQALHP
ncbi:MAG: hypothetical protein U0167_07160 [bacterium]